MGDAMSRDCGNCAYGPHTQRDCYDVVGECVGYSKHEFPEESTKELNELIGKVISHVAKEKKFSLDKLIDDHWKYNEDFASYLIPYDRAEWETSDLLALVEFSYKAAFRHGFKHAMEHYGIEEKNDGL